MEDFYLKRAFDIGELPENIDLDAPPVTGLDYLYRVRIESRKCPKIVVSNIDTAKFNQRQTVKFDLCNGFIRASPGFEPELKWQAQQLDIFSKYREELFTHREILKKKFPRREFPKLHKKQEWCSYCLGFQECNEIYGENSVKHNEASNCKRSRFTENRNPPLLSVIAHLNQNYIIRLLSYHTDWLENDFSNSQGEWLYALLMCLEKPLDPDTCALLRNLSRACSTLRSKLSNPEDQKLKSLNIIISIISHCFDQKDMSDYFSNEDAVSK